jgi:hypothetical protein
MVCSSGFKKENCVLLRVQKETLCATDGSKRNLSSLGFKKGHCVLQRVQKGTPGVQLRVQEGTLCAAEGKKEALRVAEGSIRKCS